MSKIAFTKMVGSGNDFVVVEGLPPVRASALADLSRQVCNRKFGVGADGLLVLEKSEIADVKMRILNADGSEAEMCGNGARCVALYTSFKRKAQNVKLKIETRAGIIDARVDQKTIRIKLTDPRDTGLDLPLKVYGRAMKVNFINTGVPHTVIFVEGLEKIAVENLGQDIRNHKAFAPKGTNVNFVEALKDDLIEVRTYERGVEGETLACGTGSVASALIFAIKAKRDKRVRVRTRSKELLSVYFKRKAGRFTDVWLEGRARVVFNGEINV